LSNNADMNTPAPQPNKPSRFTPVFAVIGLAAAMAGVLISQLMQPKPLQLHVGTALQPPRALPAFSLVNQDNQPLDQSYLANHWTLVFFGFTHCPDICPTTLATLASVEKQLIDLPAEQRPRVLFISVDTMRDTPELIKTYLKSFSPNFVGATGKQPDITALADAFSAPISVQSKDNNVVVDHSAALYAVNPKGQMRAVFSGPHQTETLVGDLKQLVSQDP
jgi:protein SCO1